jgi:hypothetical protein
VSRGPGSGKDQAARLAADKARAAVDPAFAHWRFGDRIDAKPQPAPPRRGRPAGARRSSSQRADDAAYRKALGLADDQPLPGKIGQASSGGAARGGPGASRKGRGRNS